LIFVIPANDDASKSIQLIVDTMVKPSRKDYERKSDRDAEKEGATEEEVVVVLESAPVAEGEVAIGDDEEEPVVPSSAVKAVKVNEGDKKRPGLVQESGSTKEEED